MSRSVDTMGMDDARLRAELEAQRARRAINAAYEALVDAARLLSVPLQLVLGGESEPAESRPHLNLARGYLDNARLYVAEGESAVERAGWHVPVAASEAAAYLRDVRRKIRDVERELEGVEYVLREAANDADAR